MNSIVCTFFSLAFPPHLAFQENHVSMLFTNVPLTAGPPRTYWSTEPDPKCWVFFRSFFNFSSNEFCWQNFFCDFSACVFEDGAPEVGPRTPRSCVALKAPDSGVLFEKEFMLLTQVRTGQSRTWVAAAPPPLPGFMVMILAVCAHYDYINNIL